MIVYEELMREGCGDNDKAVSRLMSRLFVSGLGMTGGGGLVLLDVPQHGAVLEVPILADLFW